MKAANRHILMFVDNCTAHVSVTGLTNTRLIFFPPNCTSKLQPADQGIIQNLEVHYRKTMVRKMLQYLDENQPIKAIDLKDAVFMMAKAWDNVSQTTIKNCWKKAGFPGEVLEPTHDPFESDEEDEGTSEERGLWGRVVQEYPLLADVASLDSDIITDCQPTEEDVTRQALEAVQSKQTTAGEGDESDSDVNSISVIEPTPLTPLQANEAVKALINYVMTFDESSAREREFLHSLSSMEDAFFRVQEKEKRQAKIGEYFQ
ncbi:hypothetical protein QZH41_005495 [Actinostola sp. cb2023]|nr:hypothetical protein QZH41_005495 [Actinostola sp. cb2023]